MWQWHGNRRTTPDHHCDSRCDWRHNNGRTDYNSGADHNNDSGNDHKPTNADHYNSSTSDNGFRCVVGVDRLG